MSAIKTVNVRGRIIGGALPLICAPIVARSGGELARAADEMLALRPDIVEWRVDYLDEVEDISAVLAYLDALRAKLGDCPLIFTCRVDSEGGVRPISLERRLELIKRVIATGHVDIVDFELCNGEAAIRGVREAARAGAVRLILSSHEFTSTPSADEIVARLVREQELGADIAKIAVMPACVEDLLTLLSATIRLRERHTRIPLITVSRSGLGLVSRVAAGVFGSAITFGSGSTSSAPGQIPVAELRAALGIIQKYS